MVITWETTVGFRAQEYLLPEGKGIFLGVFSSSFYCQIEQKGIILFHNSLFGTIPFGIGCGDIESLMARLRLVPKMTFICHNLELFVPATDIRLILIQKHAVHPVDEPADLPPSSKTGEKNALLSIKEIDENFMRAETILKKRKGGLLEEISSLLGSVSGKNRRAKPCGIGDLWNITPLEGLLQGIEAGDVFLAEQALNRMIGLGTGLTPTMDDVLTGLAYTIVFLRRKSGVVNPSAEAVLNLISTKGYTKTTDISGAYLRSAALGDIFTLLEEVEVSLFIVMDSHILAGRLESLLAIGSDSGGNMLIGILLGILLYRNSIKTTSIVSI
jgi:hypothetical protein